MPTLESFHHHLHHQNQDGLLSKARLTLFHIEVIVKVSHEGDTGDGGEGGDKGKGGGIGGVGGRGESFRNGEHP